MATLTPTLTLTEASPLGSVATSFTVTDILTTAAPSIGLTRCSSAVNFGDGAGVLIPEENATVCYVYIKHLGTLASNGATSTTNLVTVDCDDADAGMRLTLAATEFAFFPLTASEGLKVAAATAAVNIEFAYWSKG